MRLPLIFALLAYALSLGQLSGASYARPRPAVTTQADVTPKPKLLRDDPLLRQKITVEAMDRPLGDLLADLSPTLKADLTARREVADQRVTLHLTDQPVYYVMDRLVLLLSHDPVRPHGYYWGPLDRPANARQVYELWRDSSSVSEEEYARDYPKREIAVLLRDMRAKARLPLDQQLSYKGDDRGQVDPFYGQALKGLSDDQIDSLVRGEKIALGSSLFPQEVAKTQNWLQSCYDDAVTKRQKALAAGNPDPFPGGIPDLPPIRPVLSLTPGQDDASGIQPDHFYEYDLGFDMLGGGVGGGLIINTYDTNQNPSPDSPIHITPKQGGLIFDLTPVLTAKSVTKQQRADVGFNLQALAKTAHINLCQEDFSRSYSPFYAYASFKPNSLRTLKGSLPVLIDAICAEWNYECHEVGGVYVFWSRTWAIDRANDVPQRLIARWQQRLKTHGSLTYNDQAEIAAALTYPQIKLTLAPVLPQADMGAKRDYKVFRAIGLMSPVERTAAYSDDGLPLAAMPPWEQADFAASFQTQLTQATDDQLARAVLMLKHEQRPNSWKFSVIHLNVVMDGQTLMTAGARLPPPGVPASVARPASSN